VVGVVRRDSRKTGEIPGTVQASPDQSSYQSLFAGRGIVPFRIIRLRFAFAFSLFFFLLAFIFVLFSSQLSTRSRSGFLPHTGSTSPSSVQIW